LEPKTPKKKSMASKNLCLLLFVVGYILRVGAFWGVAEGCVYLVSPLPCSLFLPPLVSPLQCSLFAPALPLPLESCMRLHKHTRPGGSLTHTPQALKKEARHKKKEERAREQKDEKRQSRARESTTCSSKSKDNVEPQSDSQSESSSSDVQEDEEWQQVVSKSSKKVTAVCAPVICCVVQNSLLCLPCAPTWSHCCHLLLPTCLPLSLPACLAGFIGTFSGHIHQRQHHTHPGILVQCSHRPDAVARACFLSLCISSRFIRHTPCRPDCTCMPRLERERRGGRRC